MSEKRSRGRPKGASSEPDDLLLYQLFKALRIENPNITVREFADIALKNYYPGKNAAPGIEANVTRDAVVRKLNRLRQRWDKK